MSALLCLLFKHFPAELNGGFAWASLARLSALWASYRCISLRLSTTLLSNLLPFSSLVKILQPPSCMHRAFHILHLLFSKPQSLLCSFHSVLVKIYLKLDQRCYTPGTPQSPLLWGSSKNSSWGAQSLEDRTKQLTNGQRHPQVFFWQECNPFREGVSPPQTHLTTFLKLKLIHKGHNWANNWARFLFQPYSNVDQCSMRQHSNQALFIWLWL